MCRMVELQYMHTKTVITIKEQELYPLLDQRERLHVWERVRGMWKNRKPDPIRQLKKMRNECGRS